MHAKAIARSGNPDSARYAAPIAVDRAHPLLNCHPRPCFNQATTLDLQKTGPGAFRLLNLDQSHGGTGGKVDYDWIVNGYDGYMPLGWYGSDPGSAFNDKKFKEAMSLRVGDELLFPVYDAVQGSGANFEYHVIGWVGFLVTGFAATGTRQLWKATSSALSGREFSRNPAVGQKTSESAPSSSSNNSQEKRKGKRRS